MTRTELIRLQIFIGVRYNRSVGTKYEYMWMRRWSLFRDLQKNNSSIWSLVDSMI